jgi:hypothetical protein
MKDPIKTRLKDRIKDRALLVVVAIVFSIGALFFWRWAGNWGFLLIQVNTYVLLLWTNTNLQKRLKESQARNQRLTERLEALTGKTQMTANPGDPTDVAPPSLA